MMTVQIAGLDVALVVYDENKTISVYDAYTVGHVAPIIDTHQDLTVLRTMVLDNTIHASFRRSLIGYDAHDRNISLDAAVPLQVGFARMLISLAVRLHRRRMGEQQGVSA